MTAFHDILSELREARKTMEAARIAFIEMSKDCKSGREREAVAATYFRAAQTLKHLRDKYGV